MDGSSRTKNGIDVNENVGASRKGTDATTTTAKSRGHEGSGETGSGRGNGPKMDDASTSIISGKGNGMGDVDNDERTSGSIRSSDGAAARTGTSEDATKSHGGRDGEVVAKAGDARTRIRTNGTNIDGAGTITLKRTRRGASNENDDLNGMQTGREATRSRGGNKGRISRSHTRMGSSDGKKDRSNEERGDESERDAR